MCLEFTFVFQSGLVLICKHFKLIKLIKLTLFQALLLNGCKIFVCTAPSLQRLITASTVNIFNRGRLCQLVIDDFDLIVSRFDDALKFVLKRLTHIDAAKSRQSPVQLIVTARTWSPTLGLFFKIGRNVALLMGAYAEAAVYARSNVQMELVPNEEKNEKVLRKRDETLML